MNNVLINYKHSFESITNLLAKVRFMIAYALINQHIGNLYSNPSQNNILMVDKGAFLINKKTNIYVGVGPSSGQVVVHVMRRKQASDQAMHRLILSRFGQQLRRSQSRRIGFA